MSASDRLDALLAARPFLRFLGVSGEVQDGIVTLRLPYAPHLVGNVMLPALHGGIIGTLMEAAALAQLSLRSDPALSFRTIDMTIDYLRPGLAKTTHARADLRKLGRRISSLQVEAWQDDPARPIAALRGHFRQTDDKPA